MPSQDVADPRRRLPSVDRVLAAPEVQRLVELYGRGLVTVQVRRELAALRRQAVDASLPPPGATRRAPRRRPDSASAAAVGPPPKAPRSLDRSPLRLPEIADLSERVRAGIEQQLGPPLRRVLNATGILLHTNLGRSPLPRAVAQQMPALLDAYCDLELDLASGRRGERNRRAERLLRLLTGAEAALVTNNNAAALVLALAAHAAGREVVVSRGELVEIGGSFRIPEILTAAGARLVEVGTTNRTRLDDYRRAVHAGTALLLKVHPSNYRVLGFTEAVAVPALAGLAAELGLPLLVDEGAGLLRPRALAPLRDHPSHQELLAAGAALVCGSGDKLLGGPQAGLLLGRADLVARCGGHPLYRALRPSRLTYAALEGVLRRQLAGAPQPIDSLWPDEEAHQRRLLALAERVGGAVVAAEAFLGGGAAPLEAVAGSAVAVVGDDSLLARLRAGEPSVVAYRREQRVLLDLRTVAPEDDPALAAAVLAALSAGKPAA